MGATISAASPKRRIFRIVGIALLILLVLAGVAYLVGTSSAFLKRFVLPRVGRALNATVSADTIRLSPFSSIEIQNLKVFTTASSPLLVIQEARANYALRDILQGRLTIHSLTLENGWIEIAPTSSGGSTLDPILSGSQSQPSSTKPSSGNASLTLNMGVIALKNMGLRYSRQTAQGPLETLSLSNLSLTIQSLITGQPATISLASDVSVERAQAGKVESRLQASVRSDGKVVIQADGLPDSVEGNVKASIGVATGSFAALEGLSPSVQIALTPTECRQAVFQLDKAGKTLSSIRAQGPMNLKRREGQIKVSVEGVDRSILNAIAGRFGVDVGAAVLSANAQLDLTNAGQALAWNLAIRAQELSLSRAGNSTPPLLLECVSGGHLDLAAKTGRLDAFQFKASVKDRLLAQAGITAGMDLNWGAGEVATKEASLEFSAPDVLLSEWKSWLGAWADSGHLKSTIRVTAKQGGKDLLVESQIEASDVSVAIGGDVPKPTSLQVALRARVQDWNRITLEGAQANASRLGQSLAQAESTATFDLLSGLFGLKGSVQLAPGLWKDSVATTRLSLSAGVDGQWEKSGKLTLTQATLVLPPTSQVTTNALRLKGSMTFSDPRALEGAWVLEGGEVDVTPVWETFRSGRESSAITDTNAAIAFPTQEPRPSVSPVKRLRCDVAVARLACGEVVLKDVVAQGVMQGTQLDVKPFRCKVGRGNAEASALVRWGTQPLVYELAWQVQNVALEGFINTFNPSMRGTMKGELSSQLQLKGAGVTGANLRGSLVGNASLNITQAQLQIPNTGTKVWILPLDVNRIASLLNLKELTRSPIQDIRLKLTAGQGTIHLEDAEIRSDAFRATAAGNIEIVSDLGLSPLKIPIDIALSRELTRRMKVFPSAPPPEETFSKLPQFVSLGGVLSKVETKMDSARMVGLTASAAVGLAGSAATDLVSNAGKTVGKAVQGLGNLLGVKRSGTETNAVPNNTNPPAKSFNPLNLLKKKE